MKLRRTLAPSLRALLAHRVRAGLAFASISVGVAAILLTNALGAGAEKEVQKKIDALGTNLLVVRPAQVKRLVERKAIRGSAMTLSVADYEAIARLPAVAAAAPGIDGPVRAKAGASAMIANVVGTNASLYTVRRFTLTAGRFLEPGDDIGARRVAVLGGRVGETLFPDGGAVGSEIRLRGVPFEVIGVLAEKGVMADGSDLDSQILVPLPTALRRVWNTRWLNAIYVSAAGGDRTAAGMHAAEQAIAAVLRSRHRTSPSDRDAAGAVADDFAIQNATRFLSMQRQATGTLGLVASGIGVLALAVGGVGILALMLLAVKERTAEIGLRMAVGARPRDILFQFLLESALLSLGGWIAGLGAGALALGAVAFGTEWTVGLPAEALAASLVMVTVIGLGFGAVPARKASLLPPIEALRNE